MHTITLSEEEKEALLEHERMKKGRVGRRARFVMLCSKGYSAPKIGWLMDAHQQTVRRWLRRYRKLGIKGLKDKPRSGRPRRQEV